MRRRAAGLPPIRKSLGQHFLTDRRILGRIVDTLAPKSHETVIEIGPGRGALTDLLRERAARVIAIEVDRALAAILTERYRGAPNVDVVCADVLTCNLGELAGGPHALVGNVPYNITTPILFHSLRAPRPQRAVFLVQLEVANRMVASPGGKEYGALTVNLQALTTVRKVFSVAAGAFNPPPKVESAVVELRPLEAAAMPAEDETGFREMVLAIFGQRRKQMKRVVRSLAPMDQADAEGLLSRAGIDPTLRPESVTIAQFAQLFRLLPADGSVAVGKGE